MQSNWDMDGRAQEQPSPNDQEEKGLGQQQQMDENNWEKTPSSRVPLPLELNCEIFKYLKLTVQRKFIWGLGRDIYGIFGQKLLKKTKRVCKPHGNRWATNTRAIISANGLNVSYPVGYTNIFAVKPFLISGTQFRVDDFPGTICYYYEVKGQMCFVGLWDDSFLARICNSQMGRHPNSYAVPIVGHLYECRLAGRAHQFEFPEGAIQPRPKFNGMDVYGCGLVLDPENKVWIFFTLNGQLMGHKIPISPTVNRLFPTVGLDKYSIIEVNFGDDPAKPFEYDIKNLSGLEFPCI